MKKNWLYLLIIIILLAVTAYFIFDRKWGTIRKELRDFAVEDTASVTKVFLADKENRHVTLVREGEHWSLNGKYVARKDAIDNLLKTIFRFEIKAPVPKAAFNNVVKTLATQSTKVEIYQGENDPSKVFYVGGATKDQTGTYMMLENSSTPFIMHIPGFTGYLSTRFFTDETEWRDRTICSYKFNDIASVSMQTNINTGKSFRIYNEKNSFRLVNLETNKEQSKFDTVAVQEYIAGCRKLYYEYIAVLNSEKFDSILGNEPVHIITIEDINKKKTVIKTFYKPGTGVLDDYGKPYRYDADRLFAQVNDSRQLVVIQYYSFNPVFKTIDDLMK